MATTSVVVFDVNETLSDLAPMAQRFADLGLSSNLAQTWFAGVLRDGFGLAAAGSSASFSTIAEGVLRTLLAQQPANREPDAAVHHVLEGFSALTVHADVPAGVRALSDAGLRLVTLTNGATEVADRLLRAAGVRDRFEHLMSVEGTDRWKPAPNPYAYAADRCQVPASQMLMVAVHPWDVDGAARAGLRTAWIDRSGKGAYPSYFTAPDLTATGIDRLNSELAAGASP